MQKFTLLLLFPFLSIPRPVSIQYFNDMAEPMHDGPSPLPAVLEHQQVFPQILQSNKISAAFFSFFLLPKTFWWLKIAINITYDIPYWATWRLFSLVSWFRGTIPKPVQFSALTETLQTMSHLLTPSLSYPHPPWWLEQRFGDKKSKDHRVRWEQFTGNR